MRTNLKPEVILVHGLWMQGYSMAYLARWLRAAGWKTRTFSYPTVGQDIHMNAAALQAYIDASSSATVNIVAHSLGGLLSLQTQALCAPNTIDRMVFLGSPLQGSAVARRLADWRLAGPMLGQSSELLQAGLKTVADDCEIGVIAGNRQLGLGRVISTLGDAHDGTVAVHETRASKLRDHLVLPVSHSAMLWSRQVVTQTDHFLRHGKFSRHDDTV